MAKDFSFGNPASLRDPVNTTMAPWQQIIADEVAAAKAKADAAKVGAGGAGGTTEPGGMYNENSQGQGTDNAAAANVNSAAAALENSESGSAGQAHRGGRIHKAYAGSVSSATGPGNVDPLYLQAQMQMLQNNQNLPGAGLNLSGMPMSGAAAQPGIVPTTRNIMAGGALPVSRSTLPSAPRPEAPQGLIGGVKELASDYRGLKDAYNTGSSALFGTKGTPAQGNTPAVDPSKGLFGNAGDSGGGYFQDYFAKSAARGGLIARHHYKDGGSNDRYPNSEDDAGYVPTHLDIPIEQAPKGSSLISPPPASGGSGGGMGKSLGSLLGGGAGSFFGPAGTFIGSGLGGILGGLFANGGHVGRHGYATAGTVDGQDDTAPASRSLDQNIQSGNANYEAAQPQNVQAVIDREAAKRNIPIPLARGLFRQESNYDPSITSSAGEIGLGQIKPSTARDPGFGMTGVDPSTLVGAENIDNNVRFALDYLKGLGKAVGATDLNNPLHQNAALLAYNGGGDPNYIKNVREKMAKYGGDGDPVPVLAAREDGDGTAQGGNQTAPRPQFSPGAPGIIPQPGGFGTGVPQVPEVKPKPQDEDSWMSRNQSWVVPILSGLGAMASKRTISPLGAALTGLGAGATSYVNLQKQLQETANNAQRAQGTEPYRAVTERQQGATDRDKVALETLRYLTSNMHPYIDAATGRRMWKDDVTGAIMEDDDHNAKIAAIQAQMPGLVGTANSNAIPGPQTGVAEQRPVTPPTGNPVIKASPPSPTAPAPAPAPGGPVNPGKMPAAPVNPDSGNPRYFVDENQIRYDNDKPSYLAAQADRLRRAANIAQSQGSDPKSFFDEAKVLDDKRAAIMTGQTLPTGIDGNPYDRYAVVNAMRQGDLRLTNAANKPVQEAYKNFFDSRARFVGAEQKARNDLRTLNTTYANQASGRSSGALASAASVIGRLTGQSSSQAATADVQAKIEATRMLQDIAAMGGRPLVAEASAAGKTQTSPESDPAANYKLMATSLAGLNYQRDMYKEWSKLESPKNLNTVNFEQEFNEKNPFSKYLSQAYKDTILPANVTPDSLFAVTGVRMPFDPKVLSKPVSQMTDADKANLIPGQMYMLPGQGAARWINHLNSDGKTTAIGWQLQKE